MVVRSKPDIAIVTELKTRIEQLEQHAEALRTGLDDIALLFSWTIEHSVPPNVLQRVIISDEQVAAQRQWDSQVVPAELARLFLQAHTVATRLKHLVPRDEKDAAVTAVIETFRQMADEQHLEVPVEMEATIGD